MYISRRLGMKLKIILLKEEKEVNLKILTFMFTILIGLSLYFLLPSVGSRERNVPNKETPWIHQTQNFFTKYTWLMGLLYKHIDLSLRASIILLLVMHTIGL